ncbi:MAG: M18 family aminopeptidase [Sulfuriferula sp.]|nr:M18 family aminopeptidase [Sulfuriferula sp.]
MMTNSQIHATARDLFDFIDASPSPWHAVETVTQRLLAHDYIQLDETARWSLTAGGRYFVVRGASIIAFQVGLQDVAQMGLRIIGAHTDSPSLRLKTQPAHASDGLVKLGVEVYGGPILATFTDRDLSLAGYVNLRTETGHRTQLLKFDQPIVRLPNLAIHLNRDVNEQGLKLHKQNELPLIFAMTESGVNPREQFLSYIASALNVEAGSILNYEFNVFDTQNGNFWGANNEFITDSQLDNLASCHAALTALLSASATNSTHVCALFDHEEVGSESHAGASGSFAQDVIQRLFTALNLDAEDYHRALAQSFFISADMAHAYHPNFPNVYEPQHKVMVNAGPVIKTNANQRYSTNAETAARFMLLCESVNVPYQNYIHRTDLGCGSTIGPILASRLGIASVDVGCPMWAMHSLRESAGVLDHSYMIAVMRAAYQS